MQRRLWRASKVQVYMVFWCKEEAWLTRVLLTAERSPPARYSFFIPTSADIFLWTAFRKQRIPAEESDCALFSSELLLNFITDVGSSGDGRSANRRFHLSAYSNSSTSTPIPADHSSKLVVIRGSRCVLFTSDDVPDLVPLCGAGDVARTLPKALAKRGHRVMTDPFNRSHLTQDMLILNTELKQRIQDFIRSLEETKLRA
ncbi:hypothetical protein ZIOFF_063254 [Zingiber officinale]|uniref:U-box domain-containing protein n=1 Tax=Zingiber officinale TaxID=94328 RepID=A0A8J5F1P7_ZINOF|nr:hypothetical protein ZIOFF_063254 [Zingiber officinale]